jgi:cell wall-associated NlpC family hydrolase
LSDAPLDPREHPFRTDLAASYLEGKVDAERFVDGEDTGVAVGALSVREGPGAAFRQSSELLFGERFTVYQRTDGWAWGQSQTDGYVGYVSVDGLGSVPGTCSHEVAALRTYLFSAPDLKSMPLDVLHMTTRITVQGSEGDYAHLVGGGFVHQRHLATLPTVESDHVATARRFRGALYAWGGRSSIGLDCSGLVQLALARAGISAPRDSDQQARSTGKLVEGGLEAALPGDLLYMRGHVVILSEPGRVLHANAHHMAVAEEGLADFLARITGMGLEITAVRRVKSAS